MDTINILDFDDVTGFDCEGIGKPFKRKQSFTKPLSSPCDGCVCEYVCSGASAPGGQSNWGRAMCCSIFSQFVRVTKTEKRKILEPNKMPSREVYVRLFG